MAASKLEINFRRLLERCEAMASEIQENKENVSWRLEKKSPTEKLLASRQLVRPLSQTSNAQITEADKGRTVNRAQELHIRAKSQINKEMRSELLGEDNKKDSHGVRNRLTGNKKSDANDESIDSVLQYHQNLQENIAEEMIKMAQHIKHTSVMASNIIKEDNKTLEQSTKLADSNFEKLKRESERLEELTQTPCSWWIWIMIITVCIVFMWMIIFIRLFPKK
ncbi:vesicle transport protein USE1-like isoform X2 [Porites lutea]|uniref:vesicle transport protein USE1-like isoform X2 n=1 Tax=Porites lutea TaxID=51062 RepID=UPI003CC54249